MSVPVDDTVKIKARSIMGTEIPLVQHQEKPMELAYGFNNTSEALDIARERFERVKELTLSCLWWKTLHTGWQILLRRLRSVPMR